jgi:hypothetical protein
MSERYTKSSAWRSVAEVTFHVLDIPAQLLQGGKLVTVDPGVSRIAAAGSAGLFDEMTRLSELANDAAGSLSPLSRLENLGVGVQELWHQYEHARNKDGPQSL